MEKLAKPLLPIGRYRLHFVADNPICLAEFPGSAWRGALGHSLRQAACVTRQDNCSNCLLYRSCAYAWIFETPPPTSSAKMRLYSQAPHPFVLEAPETEESTTYTLGLTLIGNANQQLGLMIHALQQAAGSRRGVGHNQMELTLVEQESTLESGDWVAIYENGSRLDPKPIAVCEPPAVPQQLKIELLTALRIKRDATLVRPENFRFADLFSILLRRVSMLTYFHTHTSLETDFAGLVALSHDITANATLHWQDQARYSSRQQAEMKLGGLLGTISINNADLSPFWPYLWLGQWIHAGSAATMGLGQYRLTSL